ncbi:MULTISPECIES: substrate-binding domain-containing protein [unclassified Burkholderia]|uniref:substrate-binding domain-containing protein n=1 Tax=unclassified Burkholderia TaxID=2613784 RepID=UPI00141E8BD6|nr:MULTISPECIES: substrate-binding domain-containing protein [unclassified Burkholderia]NIE60131.1 ABC transporter substrate-binding protein [Burkholderia sp. Ap-955]NIF12129.1 ABC transporter substrate-binding protein [Burkholderia sp. Ax-1735]NIG05549.1 ABC transporter substrate-binding protein [Burkholderia sp. Tr-849]
MKKKSNWRPCVTAAAWVALCAASSGVHADDIHVLATGALHGAFAQLVPMFEKSSGHRLEIAWGPSYGTSAEALPMRLRNGEKVDICFMIKPALQQEVDAGRFDRATLSDIAASGIGVAVRKGIAVPDVSTDDALRRALLSAKSVAFSEGASGTYIVGTLFERLGIAEQMKSKSVLIRGKELVGTALARGDAELGLQQISELKVTPGIAFAGPLPADVQKTSVISSAIAMNAKAVDASRAFTAFLKTAPAVAVLQKTGLDSL